MGCVDAVATLEQAADAARKAGKTDDGSCIKNIMGLHAKAKQSHQEETEAAEKALFASIDGDIASDVTACGGTLEAHSQSPPPTRTYNYNVMFKLHSPVSCLACQYHVGLHPLITQYHVLSAPAHKTVARESIARNIYIILWSIMTQRRMGMGVDTAQLVTIPGSKHASIPIGRTGMTGKRNEVK